MSDLTFNKIAGAVLATGLAIVGLRELSAGVFAPEQPEKAGYAVEVAEEGGAGGGAVELPPDWGTLLPVADVAAGEAAFAKCKSCHTVDQGGANGTGPNLFGVVGAKPAAHAGFAYSPAMTAHAGAAPVWTYDELDAFLKAPQKHVAGTKMTFVGLKKQEERVAVIAYLSSKGGKLPVPAPDPARQPGAAAAPAAGDAAAPAAEGAPAAADAAPATQGAAGQGEAAPAAAAAPAQKSAPAPKG
ncbi:c-type cytochrome [Phenylobacterium kunshanense]|uniref:Cytochrome c family protein n=1 Tax=Phenylobacterium kunshanense TaxID=1445034 RepID=A0A328BKG6_9CAUL|nr:cytochrome c family protein [Phenylobacterium kunshanense]RAK67623.1 cytochrome c family protein [Phenylobacterium kunshanense]